MSDDKKELGESLQSNIEKTLRDIKNLLNINIDGETAKKIYDRLLLELNEYDLMSHTTVASVMSLLKKFIDRKEEFSDKTNILAVQIRELEMYERLDKNNKRLKEEVLNNVEEET